MISDEWNFGKETPKTKLVLQSALIFMSMEIMKMVFVEHDSFENIANSL